MVTSELRDVVCARCGGSEQRQRFEIRGWRIVDCVSCGMRYLSPRMPDHAYAAIYDDEYFKSPDSLLRGYEDYAGERDSILRTFRRRWKHIEVERGGRYLDIGCAFGYGLDVAAEAGMEPFGVDVSAHAVAEAKSRGLHVERGGLDEAERSFGGPFRVVTSWDVIEHLPDPRAHLATIAKLMEPGGILSIITPDRGSATARMFGTRWVEYQKPEEHIHFFRRQDLRALLADAGLEVQHETTAGKYVSIGFAMSRLVSYSRIAALVARVTSPLAGHTIYVDPLDKMHLLARKPHVA
jgi:SAM-dependent methyltransferase